MLGPHTHAYTWMYVYGLCVCCKCVLPYVHMYACMYYRSLCSLYAGQPLLCRCLGLFLTHNNTHTHAHPYTRINMYAIVKQRVREAENRVIHGHIEEKCSWEKAFSFCLLTIGVFSRTHPNIHICYKYSWVCVCVCVLHWSSLPTPVMPLILKPGHPVCLLVCLFAHLILLFSLFAF